VVIVDTTVWIDYLGGARNPQSDWLDGQLDRQRMGLTDLILCEVLQGYRDDAVFDRVLRELRRFEIFEASGSDLAIAAARNFRHLRQKGVTVRKTVDCWIATFCIRERHSLLHRDRDFDPFEKMLGLKVVHP
jgi:predicted nucleic acid-binding protein